MWISLNNAFLSIVADPESSGTLLVRARVKGHIEAVFPNATVQKRPERDYLYRAFIPRNEVATAIGIAVMGINYGNFKNSVKDDELHHAYARVWGVMASLQETPPYAGQRRARSQKTLPLGA